MAQAEINFVIEKIAVPLLLSISAWLLKDVLVGLYVARRDEARKEWLFQLREIYQPLFFWSGAALFKRSIADQRPVLDELSKTLSKAVTLVPLKHYYTFVRILEHSSNQKTSPPTTAQIAAARDFIYSRIEVLNFALFKQSPHFDPLEYADGLSPFRAVMRGVLSASTHLVSWSVVVGIMYAFYKGLEGNLNASLGIIGVSVLFVIGELVRRLRLSQALKKKMSG